MFKAVSSVIPFRPPAAALFLGKLARAIPVLTEEAAGLSRSSCVVSRRGRAAFLTMNQKTCPGGPTHVPACTAIFPADEVQ